MRLRAPASARSISVSSITPRISASSSSGKRALARKQIICDIMRRIDLGHPICGPAGHLENCVGGYDHGVPASRAGSVAAVAGVSRGWAYAILDDVCIKPNQHHRT